MSRLEASHDMSTCSTLSPTEVSLCDESVSVAAVLLQHLPNYSSEKILSLTRQLHRLASSSSSPSPSPSSPQSKRAQSNVSAIARAWPTTPSPSPPLVHPHSPRAVVGPKEVSPLARNYDILLRFFARKAAQEERAAAAADRSASMVSIDDDGWEADAGGGLTEIEMVGCIRLIEQSCAQRQRDAAEVEQLRYDALKRDLDQLSADDSQACSSSSAIDTSIASTSSMDISIVSSSSGSVPRRRRCARTPLKSRPAWRP